MPSDDAAVSFSQDCFLLIALYYSSLDTVRSLVVEDVPNQTEVLASDRHMLPLVSIHVLKR